MYANIVDTAFHYRQFVGFFDYLAHLDAYFMEVADMEIQAIPGRGPPGFLTLLTAVV